METLITPLCLKLTSSLESKTPTGKYNLKISSHVPGNSQNKRGIHSFTEVSSLTDQVSTNTVSNAYTCHSVDWQGSKLTMVAVAQPSWCEDCSRVLEIRGKTAGNPIMLVVYRLFALHCLLISGLTSVLYLCLASFFFLYHFFSTMLMFPRRPEHHQSASAVAWMWIREWHTVLVNGFWYQQPFRRLKKTFMNPLTHYRTIMACRQSIHCFLF